MHIKNKKTLLPMVFCVLFAGHGYADGHTNRNPATIGFVEDAIEVAGIKNAYSAGTAISIVNRVISGAYTGGTGIRVDGSVITATNATEEYTGTGAINVTNEVISARFTGTNGIYVPVDGSGDNTGNIQGPLAGTGLTMTTSTSGPGTLNLDTVYAAGTGITFTSASGTTTISAKPRVKVGDVTDGDGNGLGGVVVYVNNPDSNGYGTSGLLMSMKAILSNSGSAKMEFAGTNVFAWGNGVGSGAINTPNIIATVRAANVGSTFAAISAAAFSVHADGVDTTDCIIPTSTGSIPIPSTTCYGGWYLPSAAEMQLISNNNGVDNFQTISNAINAVSGSDPLETDDRYWSSTTDFDDNGKAYYIEINMGTGATKDADTHYYVRAFRQF
ncbi:MAG: DUF1566 domain-containing protein [Gammaproteobacteria bacterium]|nr:DUF1566 domain-containing protein [Gammaproteobacteria bacterium]